MKTTGVAASLVAVALLLTGCGGSSDEKPAAKAPTETITATATQMATETVTRAPSCDPPDPSGVRLTAATWSPVVASKGASDHGKYLTKILDEVGELVEGLEDGGCNETPASDTAARMNYELTLLAFPHQVTPPLPDEPRRQYDKVARLGNALFDQLGITDAQFIPISCGGRVDETSTCSALR